MISNTVVTRKKYTRGGRSTVHYTLDATLNSLSDKTPIPVLRIVLVVVRMNARPSTLKRLDAKASWGRPLFALALLVLWPALVPTATESKVVLDYRARRHYAP